MYEKYIVTILYSCVICEWSLKGKILPIFQRKRGSRFSDNSISQIKYDKRIRSDLQLLQSKRPDCYYWNFIFLLPRKRYQFTVNFCKMIQCSIQNQLQSKRELCYIIELHRSIMLHKVQVSFYGRSLIKKFFYFAVLLGSVGCVLFLWL